MPLSLSRGRKTRIKMMIVREHINVVLEACAWLTSTCGLEKNRNNNNNKRRCWNVDHLVPAYLPNVLTTYDGLSQCPQQPPKSPPASTLSLIENRQSKNRRTVNWLTWPPNMNSPQARGCALQRTQDHDHITFPLPLISLSLYSFNALLENKEEKERKKSS